MSHISSNRASYQRINPNMSLKHQQKVKKPFFAFKDVLNGNVIFKDVTTSTLHQIAKTNPNINATQVLIDLMNSKSFNYGIFSVSIVYR